MSAIVKDKNCLYVPGAIIFKRLLRSSKIIFFNEKYTLKATGFISPPQKHLSQNES
jgi:hypothetical protein